MRRTAAVVLRLDCTRMTSPAFLVRFEREFSGIFERSSEDDAVKKSRYTEEQISYALKQGEHPVTTALY